MVVNAHKDRTIDVASGTTHYYYFVESNTASTITVHQTPASVAGYTITMVDYYTHTISESDTLPSFAWRVEQDSSYFDILGMIIKSFELVFESGSETPAIMNFEVESLKVIDGTATESASSIDNLPVPLFTRKNFASPGALTLTYNGTAIESDLEAQLNKHSIKITNEFESKPKYGDEYYMKTLMGNRQYEVHYDTYIRNQTWRTISRADIPSTTSQYGTTGFYTGPIAMNTKIAHNATNYIQVSLDKMALKGEEFKNKLISWEEKELGIDVSFTCAPGGIMSAVVVDHLPGIYYEDG
jgi:hypothetical protein